MMRVIGTTHVAKMDTAQFTSCVDHLDHQCNVTLTVKVTHGDCSKAYIRTSGSAHVLSICKMYQFHNMQIRRRAVLVYIYLITTSSLGYCRPHVILFNALSVAFCLCLNVDAKSLIFCAFLKTNKLVCYYVVFTLFGKLTVCLSKSMRTRLSPFSVNLLVRWRRLIMSFCYMSMSSFAP